MQCDSNWSVINYLHRQLMVSSHVHWKRFENVSESLWKRIVHSHVVKVLVSFEIVSTEMYSKRNIVSCEKKTRTNRFKTKEKIWYPIQVGRTLKTGNSKSADMIGDTL